MSHTAVVILNFNGEKLLRQFLPSVIKNSAGAEIIVADNGSTDGSLTVLQTEFISVRVIALEKNYGFCGGYNRALKEVQADYYILLNSDIEVTPDWIGPMQELLDTQRTIAAVQPKILSYVNRDEFEYAGAAGGFIDRLGYPFCRGRVFHHLEKDHHQYDDVRPVFWATGACLMIRAALYHEFGGLDEDFFAHMEEIDLCWKLQRAGFQVYYCGRSTVYHLGAGTLGYSSPRKTYLNFRNNLSLITKHYSPIELTFKLPLRIVLDWTAGLVFLIKGQPAHAYAVLRAHFGFFGSLQDIFRKRKQLRSVYPDYPDNAVFPGIALIQAYLLRKKRLIQD